jgi:hypothetical protein
MLHCCCFCVSYRLLLVQDPQSDVALAFTGVLPIYLDSIQKFDPQATAVTLWAYCSIRAPQEVVNRLSWKMYPTICAQLQKFTPKGLVMIIYGLALARLRHEPVLDVVTGQCTARLRMFSGKVGFCYSTLPPV